MFGNYCITSILLTCEPLEMAKGQLKNISNKKGGKLRSSGFSESNFKVQCV